MGYGSAMPTEGARGETKPHSVCGNSQDITNVKCTDVLRWIHTAEDHCDGLVSIQILQ